MTVLGGMSSEKKASHKVVKTFGFDFNTQESVKLCNTQ